MCRQEQLGASVKWLGSVQQISSVVFVSAPILAALLVGIANKLGMIWIIRNHWTVAMALALLPAAGAYLAQRYAERRLALLKAEATALTKRRRDTLDRAKTELPMAAALQLLMTWDPEGDHRAYIECPPHLQKQIDELSAERDELAQLSNLFLGVLGTNVDGGWSSAAELLRPYAPLISKYAPTRLPAASNLLSLGGGGDPAAWLLSKVVATPAAAHTASRTRRASPGNATPGSGVISLGREGGGGVRSTTRIAGAAADGTPVRGAAAVDGEGERGGGFMSSLASVFKRKPSQSAMKVASEKRVVGTTGVTTSSATDAAAAQPQESPRAVSPAGQHGQVSASSAVDAVGGPKRAIDFTSVDGAREERSANEEKPLES